MFGRTCGLRCAVLAGWLAGWWSRVLRLVGKTVLAGLCCFETKLYTQENIEHRRIIAHLEGTILAKESYTEQSLSSSIYLLNTQE